MAEDINKLYEEAVKQQKESNKTAEENIEELKKLSKVLKILSNKEWVTAEEARQNVLSSSSAEKIAEEFAQKMSSLGTTHQKELLQEYDKITESTKATTTAQEEILKGNQNLSVVVGKLQKNIGKFATGMEKGFSNLLGGLDKNLLGKAVGGLGNLLFRQGATGKSRLSEVFMDEERKSALTTKFREDKKLTPEQIANQERRMKLGFFANMGESVGRAFTALPRALTTPIKFGKGSDDTDDKTPSKIGASISSEDISSEPETGVDSLSGSSLDNVATFTEKIYNLLNANKQWAEENKKEDNLWKEKLLKSIENIGKGKETTAPAKEGGGFFANIFRKLFGGLLGGGIAAFSLPLLLKGLRKTVEGIFKIGRTFIRGIGSIIREVFVLLNTAVVGIGSIISTIVGIIGTTFVSIMTAAGTGIAAFITILGGTAPVLIPAAAAMLLIAGGALAIGKALQMTTPFVEALFTGLSKFAGTIGRSIVKIIDVMIESIIKLSKISFLNLMKLPPFFFTLGLSLLSFAATASWAIPSLIALGKASTGLSNLLDKTDKITQFKSGLVHLTRTLKTFAKEIKGPFATAIGLFEKLDRTSSFDKFIDLEIKRTELGIRTTQTMGELLTVSREADINGTARGELLNNILSTVSDNSQSFQTVNNFTHTPLRDPALPNTTPVDNGQ